METAVGIYSSVFCATGRHTLRELMFTVHSNDRCRLTVIVVGIAVDSKDAVLRKKA